MKWNKPEQRPKLDSVRTVGKFALLPTAMDDGTVVWLESYWQKEKYCWWGDGAYTWGVISREPVYSVDYV